MNKEKKIQNCRLKKFWFCETKPYWKKLEIVINFLMTAMSKNFWKKQLFYYFVHYCFNFVVT